MIQVNVYAKRRADVAILDAAAEVDRRSRSVFMLIGALERARSVLGDERVRAIEAEHDANAESG